MPEDKKDEFRVREIDGKLRLAHESVSDDQVREYIGEPSPLCPSNCGFPLDLQRRTPAVYWCAWCMQFFDGDLKLLPGGSQQPKRPHPSIPRAQLAAVYQMAEDAAESCRSETGGIYFLGQRNRQRAGRETRRVAGIDRLIRRQVCPANEVPARTCIKDPERDNRSPVPCCGR